MKKGFDLHRDNKGCATALERLERSTNVLESNKLSIIEFAEMKKAQDVGISRIRKYYEVLKIFAETLKVNFLSATRPEIVIAIQKLKDKGYAPNTLNQHKAIIKSFYKWLEGNNEDYPNKVKWIKLSKKPAEKKDIYPEDLITEEETEKLIDAALNPRDKMLMAILCESGARIGEIYSLQIKNISIDEMGSKILVEGKTGKRIIRLIKSTPYIQFWLNSHPMRTNPDSPVFISLSKDGLCKLMSYDSICNLIRKIFKMAGVEKKKNPHFFRHSRASILADHLNERGVCS